MTSVTTLGAYVITFGAIGKSGKAVAPSRRSRGFKSRWRHFGTKSSTLYEEFACIELGFFSY